MKQNQTTLAKLIELRDKETPEQRKAFLEAEQRYMAEQEKMSDWALEAEAHQHNNPLCG